MSGRSSLPASTRACLAINCPRARRESGTISSDVISPGPISSARARSMADRTSGCETSNISGLNQHPVLRELRFIFCDFGALLCNDPLGSIAQKSRVLELLLVSCNQIFEARNLLCGTLPPCICVAGGRLNCELEGVQKILRAPLLDFELG